MMFILWTWTFWILMNFSRYAKIHYMGWSAYQQEYSNGVQVSADVLAVVLWLGLWFSIVKESV